MITKIAAINHVRELALLKIEIIIEEQEHCIRLLSEVVDPKNNEEILDQMGFK